MEFLSFHDGGPGAPEEKSLYRVMPVTLKMKTFLMVIETMVDPSVQKKAEISRGSKTSLSPI